MQQEVLVFQVACSVELDTRVLTQAQSIPLNCVPLVITVQEVISPLLLIAPRGTIAQVEIVHLQRVLKGHIQAALDVLHATFAQQDRGAD